MSRTAGRGGRLLGVLTLVVLGLSACGGLPGSSDVRPGLQVDANVNQRARIVVSAPIKGASVDNIARDFIRAGASFQETDENQQVVGRAYLAPTSVDRWKPTSEIVVYDAPTGLTIDRLPADQLRLTAPAVATIDASGHYAELPPGSTRTVVLSMVQVDGEWRVDLPEGGFGLWLTTDDFDRVFSAYRIHYVVAGTQKLVSDVRWFPSGPRVATALARAQLGPVPDYLRGAAVSSVPEDAQLAVDAVDVDASGTATVTLTNSTEALDPDRRRAMWAQFVSTLLQAPSITAVSLEVQGVGPIPVPQLPDAVSSTAALGYSEEASVTASLAAVRRGTQVEMIDPLSIGDGGQVPTAGPLPGLKGPLLVDTPYVGLALSADATDLAAVARSRAELVRWHGGTPLTVTGLGTGLTDPSYDVEGRLWVGGRVGEAARIWTVDGTAPAAGAPAAVTVPWLAGRRVVALRVSPDGTRVAVVSTAADATDSRLDVAGIVRAPSGQPVSLASPARQGQPLVDLRVVIWIGALDLAVLAREKADAPVRPFAVGIGGGVGLRRVGRLTADQILITPVPSAVALSSRGGIGGLVAMTSSGDAALRTGTVWDSLVGVRDLVVAGV